MKAERTEGGRAQTAPPAAGNQGTSPAGAELPVPGSPFSLQPSTFSLIFSYWLPPVAYCLLIFFQSSLPAAAPLPDVPLMDKWVHLVGYALLGALFDRAFRRQWPRAPRRRLFWAAVAATALYGASDEIHQYFVPFRHADPLDAAADALGGLLGAAAWRRLSARARHRSVARAD